MSAPNTTRWIGIGLLGLPIYGALNFYSSLDPQPDPPSGSARFQISASEPSGRKA